MSGRPMVTVAEVAKMLGKTKRATLRWLISEMRHEPTLLRRNTAQLPRGKWLVRTSALCRLLGVDEENMWDTVIRQGRRIDDLDRRVRRLEVA